MNQPETTAVARYRKKPVVVEAMLFGGHSKMSGVLWEWLLDGNADWEVATPDSLDEAFGTQDSIYIKTLEGSMRVCIGDWIIKGIKGEFYPCKPDIFAETYELVASDD